MELNQTVSALQEEIKLLKGEIKTVLKDIRTAVLTNDNPFVLGAGAAPPVPDTGRAVEEAPLTEEESAIATEPDSDASPLLPEESQIPRTAGAPTGTPTAQQAGTPPGDPAAGTEPTPLHDKGHEEPSRPPELRWNLLTIAGLMTWAEEAVGTLGRQRFEIVLELACLAELISSEVRDVLMRIAQLAPAKEVANQPMNVIEGLIVLHELEAILHGDRITKLPRRRGARHPGALVWSTA
jgi:hypothetical protein